MPNGNTATNNIDTAFTNTCAESVSTTSATPKITATSEDRIIIKSTMASSSSGGSSTSSTTSSSSSSINNNNNNNNNKNKRKFKGNDEEEHKEHKDRYEYENQATHFTVEHNGDDEMKNITQYRDTDVLCGRISKINGGHFGNKNYSRLIDLKIRLFQKKGEIIFNNYIVDISKSIVATIRNQNGRFLEEQQEDAKTTATGGTVQQRWFDIGDVQAIKITTQTLRDMSSFKNLYAESATPISATPKITATSEDRIIKSTMASSSSISGGGSCSSSINNNKRKFRGNDDEEHKERKDCSFYDEYENQATRLTVEHNGEDEGRNGDDEMENITHYRDTDILCGRGGLGNNHFGNIFYRKQVDLRKALYQKSCKFAKVDISKSIVATIRKQNGRFLEHVVKNPDNWMTQCCLPQSAIQFLTHGDDEDDDDTTTYAICRTIRTAEDFLTASSEALITAYIDYRHHYTTNGSKISAITTRHNASTQLSYWRAKVKPVTRGTVRWFDIGDARAIQKTSQALRCTSKRKRRQQQQLPTKKQQVGNNKQLQTTILCVDDDELWTTIFADPPIATNDNTVTPPKQWIHQQQETRDVVETDRPIAAPKLEQQIQQQLRMELKSIELQQLQAEISFIANDDTATVVDTSTSELEFCSPVSILSSSSRECYSNYDEELTSMEEGKDSNNCTDLFTSMEEDIDQHTTEKQTDALNNTNDVPHQQEDGTTEMQGLMLSALIDGGVKRDDDRKRKINLLSSPSVTLSPSPLSMVQTDPFKFKQHKPSATKKNVKNSPKKKSGDDENTVLTDNSIVKSKSPHKENEETTNRAANKPIFYDSNDDKAVGGMPHKRQKMFYHQFTDNNTDNNMLDSVSTTSATMHPFDANVQQPYKKNKHNKRVPWEERRKQLENYKNAVGHTNVPQGYKKNKQLATWVSNQRYLYKLLKQGKSSHMTEERIQSLNELEFSWQYKKPGAWDERRKQLANYKNTVGDTNVPTHYKENKQLGVWVNNQRCQYRLLKQGKTSAMTEERIRSLNELEFSWRYRDQDKHIPWEERRKQLASYKTAVGHTNVPRSYKKNKPLAAWVNTQRCQYRLLKQDKSSRMTEERIQSLNELEFNWQLYTKKRAITKATDTESGLASSELGSDAFTISSECDKKQRQ